MAKWSIFMLSVFLNVFVWVRPTKFMGLFMFRQIMSHYLLVFFPRKQLNEMRNGKNGTACRCLRNVHNNNKTVKMGKVEEGSAEKRTVQHKYCTQKKLDKNERVSRQKNKKKGSWIGHTCRIISVFISISSFILSCTLFCSLWV